MRLPKPVLYIAAIAACALVAFVLVKGTRLIAPAPPDAGGATIAAGGADIGGPFTLTDHNGRRVSDTDFRGRYMLIYFGYAFCPDVCPTELQTIANALDRIGAKAEQVTPIFITVDPARDTPGQLKDYVAAFHPRMLGLTGTEAEIARVAKAYRIYYRKGTPSAPGAQDYLMDHSSFVYLIGPDGKLAALFRGAAGAKALAQGLDAALP